MPLRPDGTSRRLPFWYCMPHRDHFGFGNRLAEFVDDAAGEHAAARQRDIGLVHHLRVGQLDRTSRFERTALAVLHRDEAGLGDADGESSGGEVAELVAALRVGQRRLGADVGTADAHLRAANRAAGVDGHDTAAERGRCRFSPAAPGAASESATPRRRAAAIWICSADFLGLAAGTAGGEQGDAAHTTGKRAFGA